MLSSLLLLFAGYYARVTALHNLVTQFVSLTKTAGLKSQVISLGAGFDTTYWRLCSVGLQPTNYFEVELATVTSKKCQYIKYASGRGVELVYCLMYE